MTEAALGKTPFGTVRARALDYDGDGHLDLFLVDMHSDMWMPSELAMDRIPPAHKYPQLMGGAVELGALGAAEVPS